MLKYVAATLVALFLVGTYFGDESRRQEVSRAGSDPLLGLSFASFAPSADVDVAPLDEAAAQIDEAAAVAKAMEAAKAHRAAQEVRVSLRGAAPVVPVEPAAAEVTEVAAIAPVTEPEAGPETWFVTGSRVNLRAGPSTSDAVVTQVTLGTEAEPLSDTASDWIEIRTADGTIGWIFATFLSDSAPG